MTTRHVALLAAVTLVVAAAPWQIAPAGDAALLRGAAAAAADGCGGCSGGHGGGKGRRGGGATDHGAGHTGGQGRGRGGSGSESHGGGCEHPGADQVPGGIAEDHLTGGDHDSAAHGGAGSTGGGRGRGGVPASGEHGRDARDPAAAQAPGRSPGGDEPHDIVADGHGGRGQRGGASFHEVEMGRLNVARVPDRVLDRALAEAMAGLDPQAASWYALPLDEALAALPGLPHELRLEGPLANLSLYRAVLEDAALPIAPADRLDLAALLIGSAAGRHAPVESDTVLAVSTLLGVEDRLDAAALARVTEGAERTRQAILAAHDEGGHEDGGSSHEDGGGSHEDGGSSHGGDASGDEHAH